LMVFALSFQVSDLLTEVAHLRLQLSKQQGQQQAAAFKGAALQASTELMRPEAAALQLAAAEAQAAAAEARARAAEARAAAAEARAVLAEAQLATGSGPADAVAAARHLRKVAEVCAVGAAGAVRVDDREENW
jgi:dsDNA-specific endonuclease/ATPase MutS2